MIGTLPVSALTPLDYRCALDATMTLLATMKPVLVFCRVPELEGEVYQRTSGLMGRQRPSAALWVEPLVDSWQTDAAILGGVLPPGGRLVVIASQPLARVLPERRSWGDRPIGYHWRGISRVQSALEQNGFALDSRYGFHSPAAFGLSLLGRAMDALGRPDLGDRLHFLSRSHYCTGGRSAALATVALLVARKERG